MLKRTACLITVSLVGVLVTATLKPALAEDGVEDGKLYRIILTDGKVIVGEVTALRDAYEVRTASGSIVQTIPKSRVRELIPLDDGPLANTAVDASLGGRITDAEIEEILGSENLEIEAFDYIERIDLMEELPLDEDNLKLMMQIAGKKAEWIETAHFIIVHTSTPAKARALAARLERVYEWRVWFMDRMGVPPVLPDHKFEMFFFGTHQEFAGYQALHGYISPGVLGFWHPVDNRSAFFDCESWPPIAVKLAAYNHPDTDPRIRRRGRNMVDRWVENYNMEVVQHEAGHHIDFNIGIFPQRGDVPRWLAEGLTQMFEVPPSQMGASFGKINYKKLNEFRGQFGEELERLPMLRDFMLHDAIWFMGYNYPRGWALVHYLINKFPEAFPKFMQIIAQREDDWGVKVELAEKLRQMEDLFGKIDAEWTEKFKEYINAIPMKQSELPPEYEDLP